MRRALRQALHELRRELLDPLMRSAYSLMLNSAATAVLGLLFWVLAARVSDSNEVGRDSALIAAMMTLSSIFQLNLANTVTRFLPRAGPRTRRWILYGYAVAVVATIGGAIAFVLIAPGIVGGLRFLGANAALAIAFVCATALWSVFGLQDAVMTALRRAPWVPIENAAFGVLKLALLPALALLAFTDAVFVAWMLPMVLLLIPVNYLIFARFVPVHVRRHPERRPVSELLPSRRVVRFLAFDYLGSVSQQATLALPTLLVLGLLGSTANAWFYVPFMIVTAFDTLFFNPSISLVVEGAFESASAAALLARIVRRIGKLVAPGVLVLIAAAPLILLPFGSQYSAHGSSVMRLLALASGFRILISLYVAVCRVKGRGGAIAATETAVLVLLLPAMLLLDGPLGIDGVALAWLCANALTAIGIAPLLLRTANLSAASLSRTIASSARRSIGQVGAARARLRGATGGSSRPGAGVSWEALWPPAALTSAAAIPLSFPIAPSGVRVAVLLAFLCTGPGAALLGVLDRGAQRVSPALVAATGLALGSIAGELMLALGAWAPEVVMPAAAAICLVSILLGARRRARPRKPADAATGPAGSAAARPPAHAATRTPRPAAGSATTGPLEQR